MQSKRWIMREKNYNPEDIMSLAKELSLPPIVISLLASRGISDIKRFLNADFGELYDPFLMKDAEGAAERIIKAIKNKEKITVYGDYDVDGITSTVVLVKFLKSHGADVDYYIPDRLEEGYGINTQAIDVIVKRGTNLLVTVDCGITAVDEVCYAKQKGLEVIVTDHHECKDRLPEALFVINPKQPGCNYPFKKLAGVGVVFKLVQAITLKLKFHMKELIEEYIDLVALGTVADVMPLEDENRIIVKNGLKHLRYSSNYGIRALLKIADIKTNVVTTSAVGFGLAPRINAAGRMGDPESAVSLMLSTDDTEALKYAMLLEEENKQRQAIENGIYDKAIEIIKQNPDMENDYVLVLDHDEWHHGIIGIVASKLSERYNKPCILISTDEAGRGKGSGRSIKGFNLFEALCKSSDKLIKFGGHELAAGLGIEKDKISEFRKEINGYAKEILSDDDFTPVLMIDAELPAQYLNLNTAEKLCVLEPYGMGNPSPVFYTPDMTVMSIRTLSEGRHLKMTLVKNDMFIDVIGFGLGQKAKNIKQRDKIDIVYNLDINIYRGERQAQLQLRDLRFCKGN